MRNFIKFFLFAFVLILVTSSANAYVSVKGYYRKNGTYVAPYVRSNPNGLKYDNYGWKPSQGLYNSSYGTKGSSWDTPTYVTDPTYYQGKAIYDSNHSYSGSYSGVPNNANGISNSYSSLTSSSIPSNAKAYGDSWVCNSGYKTAYDSSYNKIGCTQIIVPDNAALDYFGSDWTCNSGYKIKYDANFNKIGCDRIIVPPNAKLDYFGSDWTCNYGFKVQYDTNFNKVGCTQVIVPPNAKLDYFGSDWICNEGYKTTYDSMYNKVGCTPSN